MKPSHVRRVTLNGKMGKPSIVKGFIDALNDDRIITEKGGYLFKALTLGRRLVLGVTPYFIEGGRTFHYDTKLPGENEYTLIGSVTPEGIFDILFKPNSRELSTEDVLRYADSYVIFARFLLENGYCGEGRLDEVTVGMLQGAGLFIPAPTSITGLAAEKCSLDDSGTKEEPVY